MGWRRARVKEIKTISKIGHLSPPILLRKINYEETGSITDKGAMWYCSN